MRSVRDQLPFAAERSTVELSHHKFLKELLLTMRALEAHKKELPNQ